MRDSLFTQKAPISTRQRALDSLCTLVGASLATAAIVVWYARPLLLCGLLFVLCALFLLRWHRLEDLLGLCIGATLGNATEVACDLSGIWIHAAPQLWGAVPLYILLCYPILWLALPPLIDAVLGRRRPRQESADAVAALPWAFALWALHLLLSVRFGTDNNRELVASALCLAATLWRFRSPHDLGFAAVGAALALVWELPCTRLGAWHFAAPQLGGLIPAWLPLAYAVFFINMGRIVAGLSGYLRGAADQRHGLRRRLGEGRRLGDRAALSRHPVEAP